MVSYKVHTEAGDLTRIFLFRQRPQALLWRRRFDASEPVVAMSVKDVEFLRSLNDSYA